VQSVLGIFAKEPRPGEVKSRLAAVIGPVAAARLYEAFLHDLLPRLISLPSLRVLAFTPCTAEDYFRRLAGDQFEFQSQIDGDLGDRMAAFVQQRFDQGDKPVVLIGSDSPDLPFDRIVQAFSVLQQHELVIGPCDDGGYYLIGMSRMIPEVFADIDWSTSDVFDQTIRRAAAAGVQPAVLDSWYDVDELKDLRRLAMNLTTAGKSGLPLHLPHTAAVLQSIRHLL